MVEDIHAVLRLSPQEQVAFERQQNVYSIIKAMEFVEVKYATGTLKGPEYHKIWSDLFRQAEMSKDSISSFTTYDDFIQKYNLINCTYAQISLKEGKSRYKGEDIPAGIVRKFSSLICCFLGTTRVRHHFSIHCLC